MSDQTPDDATIEAMAKVILKLNEGEAYMEECRDLSDGILAALRAGEIPLPDDVPQLAALRARVAELEATAQVVIAARHGATFPQWVAANDALAAALAKLPKETT